eukprot:TRINITY_DN27798_c0_g5_i1.p1 TRINITY_DN27798_c0_g5~~TRINITY_DN27798_c0_g5_i1.p1  ORF type:complete len:761 (-),score=113.92 TRINITY_DN27798_c0_g5_i1:368-2650(-)
MSAALIAAFDFLNCSLFLSLLLLLPRLSTAGIMPFWHYSAREGHTVSRADEPVHFFVIGDWGHEPHSWTNGGSMHAACANEKSSERCAHDSELWHREENAQYNVMVQMVKVAREKPVSWIVNVGDNFYFEGVTSVSDYHWHHEFEDMYRDEVFHVPWLSVLGNHDYGGDCCAADLFGGSHERSIWGEWNARPMSQFDYDDEHDWEWPAEKTRRWVMPYWYYAKTIDLGVYKVRYFAIDTNVCDSPKQCLRCGGCKNEGDHEEVLKRNCPPGKGQCECFMRKLFLEQLEWLESALSEAVKDSTIVWRFLIQHHPWDFIPRDLLEPYLDILVKYKVQVLFVGHVHAMRHDIIKDHVNMVLVGSSGGFQFNSGDAPVGDKLGQTVWSSHFMDYGFAHATLTKDLLSISYINDEGVLRTTLSVESSPKYYYATEEHECDNLCGQGTLRKTITCMHILDEASGRSEQVNLRVCEQISNLIKPSSEGRCYPTAPPPRKFCTLCAHADHCDECATSFELTPAGCMHMGIGVIVEYEVDAPAEDSWRMKLDDLLVNALKNVTNREFSVSTFSVYPRLAPPVQPAFETMLRRLGLTTYQVEAEVAVASESDARAVRQALETLRERPELAPRFPDPSAPELISIAASRLICPDGTEALEYDACPSTTTTTSATTATTATSVTTTTTTSTTVTTQTTVTTTTQTTATTTSVTTVTTTTTTSTPPAFHEDVGVIAIFVLCVIVVIGVLYTTCCSQRGQVRRQRETELGFVRA